MITQLKQIEKLLEQSVWTAEERKLLLNFLDDSNEADLKEIMRGFFSENVKDGNSIDPVIAEKLLNSIHQKIGFNQQGRKAKLVRIWALRIAAACFAGYLALSTFMWLKNNSKQPLAQMHTDNKKYKSEIQPGSNKAILTLADGSSIILDSAHNGTLSSQGNTKIIKLNDGQLAYKKSGDELNSKILYNTISTPNGGQYRLTLADGSQVWLNSGSSFRFPIPFAGKERRVEVTGEVYFEVAQNKAMPFIVSVNGAEIHVLGTHFDVMAYHDEPSFQTTLLEGSIKFLKNGNATMLKPGQQLQLSKNDQQEVVSGVDLTKVVAWKNGFFDFKGLDFETISRQLSRWYNVEVIYNRKIDEIFYAEIPRNTRLVDVLKALELTGKVHFEIEATKIIVLP